MYHDTRTAREKTIHFADTVKPFVEHGWPQAAMLPAWPGKKQPGRYLGSAGWCGLEGNGLLKHGLSAAAKPTTWEQVQAWPTDGLCVLGGTAPGLDVDSEVPAVLDAVRALLPWQTYERGRSNSLRTLLPFRSTEPVKGWKPLRFTMDGYKGVQVVEFNGHGRQWIAAGRHRSGGRYVWRDSVGDMGGPPAFADLRVTDQMGADVLRESIALALKSIGAVFVDGSRYAGPAAGQQAHDMVETDGLEPLVDMDLLERVLREIPDTHETVGGWDDAIPLLASMRFVLGHLGAILPGCVEDWAADYPGGSVEWIEGRWSSFDQGVAVRHGTFLQWVAKHGSAELSTECETAVNGALAQRVFEETEELDDDQYGQPDEARADPGAGGGGGAGDRPAAGRVELDRAPNLIETQAAILMAPELGRFAGWCEFRHQVMLRKAIPRPDGRVQAGFVERPWEDNDDLAVQAWLQSHGLRKLVKGTTIDACSAVARYFPFHPVRDYLRGVRWDGVDRLSTWLIDYCGAEPGKAAYLKAVGRAVMISAVARVMRPGCKVDTVIVMEGAQGVGKSSLFKALMPVTDWFSDSMPHDLANKDAVAHLKGKWVIEIPELAQFKRTEMSALKSFISTAVDTYRPAYGRNEVTYARQGIFVASTNEDGYLVDQTGNRRYLPVKLGDKRMDLARVEADRDLLWAEAVAALDRGEQWWISDADIALAVAEQSTRTHQDDWTPAVVDYVDSNNLAEVTTNTLLRNAIKMDVAQISRAASMRMADVLKAMGWARVQVRTPDGRSWVYRRPVTTSAA